MRRILVIIYLLALGGFVIGAGFFVTPVKAQEDGFGNYIHVSVTSVPKTIQPGATFELVYICKNTGIGQIVWQPGDQIGSIATPVDTLGSRAFTINGVSSPIGPFSTTSNSADKENLFTVNKIVLQTEEQFVVKVILQDTNSLVDGTTVTLSPECQQKSGRFSNTSTSNKKITIQKPVPPAPPVAPPPPLPPPAPPPPAAVASTPASSTAILSSALAVESSEGLSSERSLSSSSNAFQAGGLSYTYILLICLFAFGFVLMFASIFVSRWRRLLAKSKKEEGRPETSGLI